MADSRLVLSSYVQNNNDLYSVLYFDQDNISPHSHEFFEFVYVLKGSALHALDGIASTVRAGDFFIIDIGSVHSYESRNNFKIINILFAPEFLDPALHNTTQAKDLLQKTMLKFCHLDINREAGFRSFSDRNGEMRELFEKILKEYQEKLPGFTESIRFLLLRAFLLMIRESLTDQPDSLASLRPYKTITREAITFLENNYASPHYLNDFCREYHYSPEYVSRLFKEQTGMTLTAFTQKCRVEAALVLLKQTDLSVADLAAQVGYQDIKSFQKTFKALTGMTPSQCRRLQQT